MDKNRRNKKYNNWNKKQQDKNQEEKPVFQFNKSNYEDENLTRERQKAILELKAREVICPKCGKPITDMASSINDKASGAPVHFECVMDELSKSEVLGQNEKIAYIGQGRFGILYFENPRDQRHFTIKKIIEWEDKDKKSQWREEISSLYSQIN